jgi:hypothetical protein
MARTKKADPKDLEIAQLKEQLLKQELNQAAVIGQLSRQQGNRPANVAPGQLFVGIRNVSNYTIGIANTVTREGDLHLHAPLPDGSNQLNTVAVISYAWWAFLRKAREYGRGLIVRDDSILGGTYDAAPEDGPADCHPEHARNLVVDAEAWVAERSEDEIRRDVERMTSTETLRKLDALHFKAHEYLMEKHAEEKWATRKHRVERDMPSKLRHLKAVIVDRLRDIAPNPDPNILPQFDRTSK